MTREDRSRAWWLVVAFAAAKFLLHIVVTLVTPYEVHRDEFLYLAMGEHLRLWAMDFPPAIAILANFSTGFFGGNLFAVRFLPAIAGSALVAITGLLVREFGGGRPAQAVAMLCVICSPLFMRAASLFQPVVFDQLWWTLGLYALALVARQFDGNRVADAPSLNCRPWILLGIACGLGLLTKFSILFFGLALSVSLLLVRYRFLYLTRGPWLASAVALVIGSPSIVGQIRLDFPVLIHMSDLRTYQLERVTYSEFLSGQALMLGPGLIVAIVGLVHLVGPRDGARLRILGLTCAGAFLLLMVLHGKAYYSGPIYPTLFAAGAASLWAVQGKMVRLARGALVGLIIAAGFAVIPFGLPVLPPKQMARYAAAMGVKAAVTTNRGTVLPLPQDYADMLGWKEQVAAVAKAFRLLPQDEHGRAGLIARNYGEAGALEFYGPRFGLPRRVMLPDNVLLWPADPSCDAVVTIGIPPRDVEQFFQKVEIAGYFDHPWMVEEERNRVICVAQTPSRDLREAWKTPVPHFFGGKR